MMFNIMCKENFIILHIPNLISHHFPCPLTILRLLFIDIVLVNALNRNNCGFGIRNSRQPPTFTAVFG